MKIAISQLNYHIGNLDSNKTKIIKEIEKAKNDKADLIVFSELSICGYPPADLLEFDEFIKNCLLAIDEIAKYCINIAAIVGSPTFNNSGKGKRLFNSALFLHEGKTIFQANKTLLPNYDVFDECRYFEPNNCFDIINYKNEKIAITICEDLWNIESNEIYNINPMDVLITKNPSLIINIAASPFNYKQAETRKNILEKNILKYKTPIIYVNQVGAQTELIFDGGSVVINEEGKTTHQLKYFEEDYTVFNTESISSGSTNYTKYSKIELIHKALIMGVKDYFQKLGFTKAILGLSGGIDSALTLAIAVEALGNKNVEAIMLPSQYSSEHSIKDAEDLAKNLDIKVHLIPIKQAYDALEITMKPFFNNLPFNIAEENIQARIRGVILMAFCNKFGHILLNTSNKSESAVGYGTLYGDMNGGLSVLGDVYKTEVFELAKHINKNKEIIPENTICKEPSAELRPDQKDSDSLPKYEILDAILFQYIENQKTASEIIEAGFNEAIVRKIIKMVNANEHKRYQNPPTLRVSTKAFGSGRRIPIVAKYTSN